MAKKEDIRKRIKALCDPAVVAAGNEIEKKLDELGCHSMVTLTSDMTPEEEEMALFEGLLKDGYLPAEAERKAKEQVGMFTRIFGR